MQINERLYPHPVLSWFADDYIKGIFQPSISVVPNKSFFRIVMVCRTSSKSLRQLISEKKASYSVHVECSSTRFRAAFTSFEENFEIDIPVSDLEGKVEVSRFIVCTEDVKNYSSEEFHADFAGRSFDLLVGDVLAVAETVEFPAIKKDDELAKLPSIFSILRSHEDDAASVDVDLSGKKIKVLLSPEVHQKFIDLNSDVSTRATLCCALLVPALIMALELIRDNEDLGELFDKRWFHVLAKRLQDLGIDIMRLKDYPESNVVLANKLLEDPLLKSFTDLESLLIEFGEDQSE